MNRALLVGGGLLLLAILLGKRRSVGAPTYLPIAGEPPLERLKAAGFSSRERQQVAAWAFDELLKSGLSTLEATAMIANASRETGLDPRVSVGAPGTVVPPGFEGDAKLGGTGGMYAMVLSGIGRVPGRGVQGAALEPYVREQTRAAANLLVGSGTLSRARRLAQGDIGLFTADIAIAWGFGPARSWEWAVRQQSNAKLGGRLPDPGQEGAAIRAGVGEGTKGALKKVALARWLARVPGAAFVP